MNEDYDTEYNLGDKIVLTIGIFALLIVLLSPFLDGYTMAVVKYVQAML